MSTDKTFEENLAMGIAGEDLIYKYLVKNNSYVEDNRSKNHDFGSGPKLVGTDGEIILPDFVVYNKNPEKGNYALDVKVKSSTYPINGKRCFTADNKYEQYKRIVELKKLDYLVMCFVYNNRNYYYKDSECTGTTVFNNQYSSGIVYLFEVDKNKIRY